jgi:hypothetical protein
VRHVSIPTVFLVAWLAAAPAARADDVETTPGDGWYTVEVDQTADDQSHPSGGDSSGGAPLYDGYKWQSATPSCASITCTFPQMCTPPQVYRGLWGHPTDGGDWVLIRNACTDPGSPAGPPSITSGVVLKALERVGLPALRVHTNPSEKTLVNLDTIFYTDPATVTKTLALLGQSVLVEATPASYTWRFGDGEASTTESPGAAYPAMDLTHKYLRAKVTVNTSVDTTYTARFRVNGGEWQDVDGTVTITGPSTALRVAEATPVLSGNR